MFDLVISDVEMRAIFGLILSLVAGYIIGIERESRGKDAGISTHSMVVAGSAMFTLISAAVDPASTSRIAAQVVTGVGFLGGGMILKEGSVVKNLTTAASLWVSASIGMAFGFGLYFLGIVSTFIVAIIPRLPHLSKTSPEALMNAIAQSDFVDSFTGSDNKKS